jgi:hypothetical protein
MKMSAQHLIAEILWFNLPRKRLILIWVLAELGLSSD